MEIKTEAGPEKVPSGASDSPEPSPTRAICGGRVILVAVRNSPKQENQEAQGAPGA
ncbi:MAG: hypothetical protein WA252_01700 [Candidatus Sulfotelmatobacter sp.]